MPNSKPTPTRPDFDAIVLGGGSAGYAAARTLAAGGQRVAVIEGGAEVGGLCILRGCMPTKALLYAAEVAHLTRHAATWGISVPPPGVDFAAVMARKDAMVEEFAAYRRQQLADGRFTFLRAMARFDGPNAVMLDDHRRLTAARFVVATGSRVATPSIPGLADAGYLTSDDALALTAPPESLIILGGGSIACEFSQFFARMGTRVIQIQRGAQVLRAFDEDIASAIGEALRKDGVDLHTGARLLEAGRNGATRWVRFESHGEIRRVEATHLLLALGRVPNTSSLHLAAAGVQVDGSGRILTNEEMRTSAPHIMAAGDCTSENEVVHIAIQQAEIAAHNLLYPDRPRRLDNRLAMSVVFTDPQAAMVGKTEKDCRLGNIRFATASYPFADHGKSILMEAKIGRVKLLADPDTGLLLGGAVAGPSGGELIHEIVVAMAAQWTARQLAATPHYHPSLAEIWTYPAEELAEATSRNEARPATP
ncbi:MAG: NAD(P)/FAD-dependent oxidoreductase [Verrucomicrobiales bacterium]|nr:NAD(P)/FAD-dependent oxidoreductase [Verrucomicrobiales bacterium]